MSISPATPSVEETIHLLVSAAIQAGWAVVDMVIGGVAVPAGDWPLPNEAPPGALVAGDQVALRPPAAVTANLTDVITVFHAGITATVAIVQRERGAELAWDTGVHLPAAGAVQWGTIVAPQAAFPGSLADIVLLSDRMLCYIQLDAPNSVLTAVVWGYMLPYGRVTSGATELGDEPDPAPLVSVGDLDGSVDKLLRRFARDGTITPGTIVGGVGYTGPDEQFDSLPAYALLPATVNDANMVPGALIGELGMVRNVPHPAVTTATLSVLMDDDGNRFLSLPTRHVAFGPLANLYVRVLTYAPTPIP